jgi:hypothetical protein
VQLNTHEWGDQAARLRNKAAWTFWRSWSFFCSPQCILRGLKRLDMKAGNKGLGKSKVGVADCVGHDIELPGDMDDFEVDVKPFALDLHHSVSPYPPTKQTFFSKATTLSSSGSFVMWTPSLPSFPVWTHETASSQFTLNCSSERIGPLQLTLDLSTICADFSQMVRSQANQCTPVVPLA